MEYMMFFHEGEVYSKEAFLEKIRLPEDVYNEMQRKKAQDHKVDSLYHIQLYDYNTVAFVSGVTNVFTEDIEDFSQKYLSLEDDKERIDRF